MFSVDRSRMTLVCCVLFLGSSWLMMDGCCEHPTKILGIPIGCQSSGGEILVGHPSVFTRARLVNRRLTEQQWLESQLLNTPNSQSLQGYIDVRSFEGIYNKTSASFDPLAAKLSIAQNGEAVQSVNDQAQTNALQQQINMLKLQQQLDQLKKGDTAGGQNSSSGSASSGSSGSSSSGSAGSAGGGTTGTGNSGGGGSNASGGSTGGSGSTGSGNAGGSSNSSSGGSNSSGEAASSSGGSVFSNPPALPSAGDTVASLAKITSIELLRDQLAYRDAIQAALREQELDDTHDLDGRTLYTLKFDLSVLPHGENHRLAKVEFRLDEINPSDAELTDAYEIWVSSFRQLVSQEAIALQRRLAAGLLTDDEKLSLATNAAGLHQNLSNEFSALLDFGQLADAYDANQRAGQVQELLTSITSSTATPKPASSQDQSNQAAGAARVVQYKYQQIAAEKIVSFDPDPTPIQIGGKTFYIPTLVRHTAKEQNAFIAKVRHLNLAAAVSVVDPKEEAQNISDVQATEKLRDMVLSLQAAIPQIGTSFQNYTEYMNRSQQRLQAIMRTPLVVGYSHSGSNQQGFGWIIGPRFEIGGDGTATFTHTAAQHSVQAVLCLPGWLRYVKIPYSTYWVDDDGSVLDKREGSVNLTLPADESSLTQSLLASSGVKPLPTVLPPMGNDGTLQVVRVQAGSPADFIVRGTNLWKNPKVFVGNQPADGVSVLPDMNGLAVHIANVNLPPHKTNENPLLDVTVITSEGPATIPGLVQVYPLAQTATDKLAASVESKFVVGFDASAYPTPPEQLLTLSASSTTVPTSFNEFQVWVRPLKGAEQKNVAAVNRSFAPITGRVFLVSQADKVLFEVPSALPWTQAWQTELGIANPADGMIMQAQLMMRARPDDVLTPIPATSTSPLVFVYFPDSKTSHAALATTTVNYDTKSQSFQDKLILTLGTDSLFSQGYADLSNLTTSGVSLQLTDASGTSPIISGTTLLVDGTHVSVESKPRKAAAAVADPDIKALLTDVQVSIDTTMFNLPAGKPGAQTASQADPFAWLRQQINTVGPHAFKVTILLSGNVRIPVEPNLNVISK